MVGRRYLAAECHCFPPQAHGPHRASGRNPFLAQNIDEHAPPPRRSQRPIEFTLKVHNVDHGQPLIAGRLAAFRQGTVSDLAAEGIGRALASRCRETRRRERLQQFPGTLLRRSASKADTP